MRPDLRKNSEIRYLKLKRRIQMETSILSRSDGSSKFEFGNTGIICAINGPMEAARKDELHDRAYIECTFASDCVSIYY